MMIDNDINIDNDEDIFETHTDNDFKSSIKNDNDNSYKCTEQSTILTNNSVLNKLMTHIFLYCQPYIRSQDDACFLLSTVLYAVEENFINCSKSTRKEIAIKITENCLERLKQSEYFKQLKNSESATFIDFLNNLDTTIDVYCMCEIQHCRPPNYKPIVFL